MKFTSLNNELVKAYNQVIELEGSCLCAKILNIICKISVDKYVKLIPIVVSYR